MVNGLVSTIIPVYNRSKMLIEAVDSVINQTYQNIEIIISDDGSTDETGTVARELSNKYNNVVYIVNENRGPGPARESGRVLANGEFIQYLDSDDRLLPNKFEDQVKALNLSPECGISYGITRLIDFNNNIIRDSFKWTGRRSDYLFPWLLIDRWWCTHTPLYRRSVCDLIGPWSNLRFSQDWEYDGRLGAIKTKLCYVPKIVSEHRVHEGMRQTGHPNQILKDKLMVELHLHELLYQYALTAGVGHEAKEMKHFSRAAFMYARWMGSIGMANEAEKMLSIAQNAGCALGYKRFDMVVMKALVKLFGWRYPCKIAIFSDHLRKRSSGVNTIPWAWT